MTSPHRKSSNSISRRSLLQGAGKIGAVAMAFAPAVRAAPDELAQGRLTGYPTSRRGWNTKPYRVGNFSALDSFFPHHVVRPSLSPLLLSDGANDRASLNSDTRASVKAYFESNPITGLLIIRNGQIAFEEYQYGRTAKHKFHGWSMSKTILGLAIGAAMKEGLLTSINDTAQQYVPELAGTLHGEVSLKNLLQMSTGADVVHKPRDQGGNLDDIYNDNLLTERSDTFSLIKNWNRRSASPGRRFNYNELAPITLSHVLIRASDQSLSSYLESRIWQPAGCEAGASWIIDSKGKEFGCIGFSATLRDWGRVGLLMANDGIQNNASILDPDWIQKATTVDSADSHLRPRVATTGSGYGYLVWIDNFQNDRVFSMRGHQSQFVIIAPASKLVMVQTAVEHNSIEFNQPMYKIFSDLMKFASWKQ